MLSLTPVEARILGVLVEKAQTVPAQYPLTLNSLVAGCNQKNNRDPVTEYTEDDVLDAIDGLKQKKLVTEVMLAGSRVSKYRHLARDVFGLSTQQLVILAELLLRGPQSVGELRGRASRMAPFESLEQAQEVLNSLMASPRAEEGPEEKQAPLVRSVPPAPGSRAIRFAQLLAPDLHPVEAASAAVERTPAGTSGLAARVEKLEADVKALEALVQRLSDRLEGH